MNDSNPSAKFQPSAGAEVYKIVLRGELDPRWSEWFDGMDIARGGGRTVLLGPIKDQAALHGIFHKIRDLNLTLLAVIRVDEEHSGRDPLDVR